MTTLFLVAPILLLISGTSSCLAIKSDRFVSHNFIILQSSRLLRLMNVCALYMGGTAIVSTDQTTCANAIRGLNRNLQEAPSTFVKVIV